MHFRILHLDNIFNCFVILTYSTFTRVSDFLFHFEMLGFKMSLSFSAIHMYICFIFWLFLHIILPFLGKENKCISVFQFLTHVILTPAIVHVH